MSEFEDFIKAKYPVDYESLKEKYPNVPVVEFYGDELDVWNHQQSEIDQLKAEKSGLEKRISKTLEMLDGDLSYVEEDRRCNFDFLQMAMIRCLKDDMKALRGEHE